MDDAALQVGLLTTTVIRSPVIKQILRARLRSSHLIDVVFIGEDFVHVKHGLEGEGGHLEHVAFKNDFDARIRAACTFETRVEEPEDALIKGESDGGPPADLLVLTLDSNEMLFLYLCTANDGRTVFKHQSFQMPRHGGSLFNVGDHVAVDPRSRAIAVAASDQNLVVYSAKDSRQLGQELRTENVNWCPVSEERQMVVHGVIQLMAFLHPMEDDQDRIILLLIVINDRKTKAVWIDWYTPSDLPTATAHPGLTLGSAANVPNLLIPLKHAAFVLVNAYEMELFRNMLAGSTSSNLVHQQDVHNNHSGNSQRRPLWTSWCRPPRIAAAHRERDEVYLVREDGLVTWLKVKAVSATNGGAGYVDCQAGNAFACLGNTKGPDVLVVAGEMCSGRIASIGRWSTNVKLNEHPQTRVNTNGINFIGTIPNWASTTDAIVSTLAHSDKSGHSRQSILLTSGRQPHGSVTILRFGLEARVVFAIELPGFEGLTDLWTLPLRQEGCVLAIMSSPSASRLLKASADMVQWVEVDQTEAGAFDYASRTLSASYINSGQLVQVTENCVRATFNLLVNFEDNFEYCPKIGSCSRITAAAIDPFSSMVVISEKNDASSWIRCFHFSEDGPTTVDETSLEIPEEVLCIAALPAHDGHSFCVAATDRRLLLLRISKDRPPHLLQEKILGIFNGFVAACDSAVVFPAPRDSAQGFCSALAVFGTRDGKLVTALLEIHGETASITETGVTAFAQSAVKLMKPSHSKAEAFATSEHDLCRIAWSGKDDTVLRFDSIWTSEKGRPQLSQRSINSIACLPPADLLSTSEFAEMFVFATGNELQISTLAEHPTAVPRQIRVSGTPSRLLYAEQQRSIVCASIRAEARTFPSSMPHSAPEERRQIWPVIDFIPASAHSPSFTYEMQPGEKVYAMLEWTFRSGDDKTYSHLLIGGSYTRPSGNIRGRVTFLQPKIRPLRQWEVEGVQDEPHAFAFKDGPVFALALYDDVTYIACAGKSVSLHRFDPRTRRWTALCKPHQLASHGRAITVDSGIISIVTTRDSLVQLALRDVPPSTQGQSQKTLVVVSAASRADQTLSHLLIDLRDPNSTQSAGANSPGSAQSRFSLVSTSRSTLFGLSSPWHPLPSSLPPSTSAEILFEANLSRSLTRLCHADVRPPWKAPLPAGVLVSGIIGTSADGSLTGISFLGQSLWRRLFWLQRLCEWSDQISPHSYRFPTYSPIEDGYQRVERTVPVGLAGNGDEKITLRVRQHIKPETDAHINGDILARLSGHGGTEAIRSLIRTTAQRSDEVGDWVKGHLDYELAAVDGLMGDLDRILDCWF